MKERVTTELTVYRLILQDSRTRPVKWVVGSAVAYAVWPLLPVLGYLDDVVVCLVIVLSSKIIFRDLIEEYRRSVQALERSILS